MKKKIKKQIISGKLPDLIVGEFWTSKQRQGNKIHEISYRACFKSELPGFFIDLFTNIGDVVYDPFSGRGTTGIEALLRNRVAIFNDINPLSNIVSEPRTNPPNLEDVEKRLNDIFDNYKYKTISNKLDMFFENKTYSELLFLKKYLQKRKKEEREDYIDKWIRMVATNRLTGHSSGFFSVYTLPPNQALSADRQKIINKKRAQTPEYRDIKKIIIKKTKTLISEISEEIKENFKNNKKKILFLNEDATNTRKIKSGTVDLVVTSPPFLDVIDYAEDNWLRFWFNDINKKEIGRKITIHKKIDEWELFMESVLKELKRVLSPNGHIAFEVGEIRGGKIKLDENITLLAKNIGLNHMTTLINEQNFTKTSNIWGVNNGDKGTNTNRIVLLNKKNK